jgi:hypothetical protein
MLPASIVAEKLNGLLDYVVAKAIYLPGESKEICGAATKDAIVLAALSCP